MTPSEFSENDPLAPTDDVLGDLTVNAELRRTSLADTLGVIRRRRRLKRCVATGVLLGCYLAGVSTTASLRSREAAPQSVQNVAVAPTVPPDFAGPPDQKAVYKVADRYEVLRREADLYLNDPENLQLAVHTYSRALKYASAAQRAVSTENDSWMLIALKEAYSKEKKNDAQL